jgi:hypothetical protein
MADPEENAMMSRVNTLDEAIKGMKGISDHIATGKGIYIYIQIVCIELKKIGNCCYKVNFLLLLILIFSLGAWGKKKSEAEWEKDLTNANVFIAPALADFLEVNLLHFTWI